MGVDHGGMGDKSPQNLERGDCPPDFVMLQNFKQQITCITMYENVFFCLSSRIFIVRPAMRPPQNSSQITPMSLNNVM